MQLKICVKIDLVSFFHLTFMENVSPITLIKSFLFFLTFLVAFSSILKDA